jgi:hypothetical protein
MSHPTRSSAADLDALRALPAATAAGRSPGGPERPATLRAARACDAERAAPASAA